MSWLEVLLSNHGTAPSDFVCTRFVITSSTADHITTSTQLAVEEEERDESAVKVIAEDTDEPSVTMSTLENVAQEPPASDGGLHPQGTARTTSGVLTSSSSISMKPRKQMGAMRIHASNVIRKFWIMCRLKLRLRSIFREASAIKIQALYRGFQDRQTNRELISQCRNDWLMSRYANIRTVHVASLPPLHVRHLAARSIQLLFRRRRARHVFLKRKLYSAARRIQAFYRCRLFARFMGTVADRRILRDRRSFAATKVQAIVRGYLARVRFAKTRAALESQAALGFPQAQREQRKRIMREVEADVNEQLVKEKARLIHMELLSRIRKAKNPNREIVLWSAESVINTDAVPLDAPSLTRKPLAMVPAATGTAGFVSQARPLPTSEAVKFLEACAANVPTNLILVAKQDAVKVAQRHMQRKEKILGKYKEENATMRYALAQAEVIDRSPH